jgi:hypothetical protein
VAGAGWGVWGRPWGGGAPLHHWILSLTPMMYSTPALASQAAAACRYPPRGLRGCGPGLAEQRWTDTGMASMKIYMIIGFIYQ